MSFLLFLLCGGVYGLLNPLDAGPDEGQHVVRAASVVRGDLVPPLLLTDKGALPTPLAPRSYDSAAFISPCFLIRADLDASCAPPLQVVPGDERISSTAGRYPPLYYALTGWPTLLSSGAVGVRLVRLATAALLAAFLASGLCSALGSRLRAGLGPAYLVAVTPMVLYLGGVVNPSALEVGASLSLWLAVLVLLTGTAERDSTQRLVSRAGVACVALLLTRSVSPVFVVLIVAVALTQARRATVRDLLRRGDVRVWVGALVAVAAVGAVSLRVLQPALPYYIVPPVNATTQQAVRGSLGQWGQVLVEMIGDFGYNESPAPALVLQVWPGLVVALLLLAVLGGGGRRRLWGAAAAAAAVLAFQLAIQVTAFRTIGLGWQGRYVLGLAVGVPLLAAVAVGEAPALRERLPSLAVGVAAITGAAQVVTAVHAWRRYATGIAGPLDPLDGAWQPPGGGVLLIATFAAATTGLGVMVVRAARTAPLVPSRVEPVARTAG